MSDMDEQDYAFLGREFLTWLLWQLDIGDAAFSMDEQSFSVACAGRVKFGGIAGDVSKGQLDGKSAGYSIEVKAAIGAGRTIREVMLKFVMGEREWVCSVSDTLDLRGVKLPALLTEETDDRFNERMALLDELNKLVGAMYVEFMQSRTRPDGFWKEKVVPAIGKWATATD